MLTGFSIAILGICSDLRNDPHHERNACLLSSVESLPSKVTSATDCQVSAFGMKDCQIPGVINHVELIPLIMWPRGFRRKKIATHGVMPSGDEGIANGSENSQATKTFIVKTPYADPIQPSTTPLPVHAPSLCGGLAARTPSRRTPPVQRPSDAIDWKSSNCRWHLLVGLGVPAVHEFFKVRISLVDLSEFDHPNHGFASHDSGPLI